MIPRQECERRFANALSVGVYAKNKILYAGTDSA